MRKIRFEHTNRDIDNPGNNGKAFRSSMQSVEDYEKYLGRKNLKCQHSKVNDQIEEILKKKELERKERLLGNQSPKQQGRFGGSPPSGVG